jgi:hypothetical protein
MISPVMQMPFNYKRLTQIGFSNTLLSVICLSPTRKQIAAVLDSQYLHQYRYGLLPGKVDNEIYQEKTLSAFNQAH